MKKIVLAAGVVSLAFGTNTAIAKDKKEISSLELQQIQSREFEAKKEVAFASVMTVLQDSGYRIGSADKDTGLITGAASTKTNTTWVPFVGFGKKKKTPVVSAYIEERGPNMSRVRFNFVMTKSTANSFGSGADEEPITDPAVYKDAFEKVEKELFVRQAMNASPAAPTPAVVPEPVSTAAAPTASSN